MKLKERYEKLKNEYRNLEADNRRKDTAIKEIVEKMVRGS